MKTRKSTQMKSQDFNKTDQSNKKREPKEKVFRALGRKGCERESRRKITRNEESASTGKKEQMSNKKSVVPRLLANGPGRDRREMR